MPFTSEGKWISSKQGAIRNELAQLRAQLKKGDMSQRDQRWAEKRVGRLSKKVSD